VTHKKSLIVLNLGGPAIFLFLSDDMWFCHIHSMKFLTENANREVVVTSSLYEEAVCKIFENTALTLYGFDDQERNLTFVKTDFQVLKLKFHACSFKQAFYPLHKLYIA